jgi:hypothetical protein
MSMQWDYVSLLIPQVIYSYEYGEPWWNINRRISWFVHQSSLAILPAESSMRKAEGNDKGNDEFCLTKYLFHTLKGSLTCCKIVWHVLTALLPLWRNACCGFLYALKPIALDWVWICKPCVLWQAHLTTRPPQMTVINVVKEIDMEFVTDPHYSDLTLRRGSI